MFDVNVKATYVSCQEFSRYLLDHGLPGKIINIASVTAFQANINTSVYSATKGAVVQLTKAFSNELASKGIQVNCISPG
jgi:2-deoxy-D-gluconate 3-dehydrogenase